MRSIRGEVSGDVSTLKKKAKDAANWRSYVERYPLPCLGAVAVLGYLAVPARRHALQLSDEQLERLARSGALKVTAAETSSRSSVFAKRLLVTVGTIAARAAIGFVGTQLGSATAEAADATDAAVPWFSIRGK
jgi:hypothetical protein